MARGTADDHIWPLVQSKLNVLNRAGLSKDDFTEADQDRQQSRGERQARITELFSQLEKEDEPSEGADKGQSPGIAAETEPPTEPNEHGPSADDRDTLQPSAGTPIQEQDAGGSAESAEWLYEVGDIGDFEEWMGNDSWDDIPQEGERPPAKKAKRQGGT